jgi:mannose-1-phosphate guanylyltransferase
MSETGHRWAVILAGGEGERMRAAITSWLGTHRPKQYCSFVGSRSMLEHTVDRARRLDRSQM